MTHPCPTCHGTGHVEVTPVAVLAPPKPETDDKESKPKPRRTRLMNLPYNSLGHLRKF